MVSPLTRACKTPVHPWVATTRRLAGTAVGGQIEQVEIAIQLGEDRQD